MSRTLPVVALLVALVLTGCSGAEETPRSGPSSPAPSRLEQVDTTRTEVPREAFCDDLGRRAVTRALGAAPVRASSWGPGEEITPAPGVRQPGDERGCAYAGPGRARASAWVFAPPVGAQRAGSLVGALGKARGCRRVPQAADFGQPSLARVCSGGPGSAGGKGTRSASFHGLFGDAWVTCRLTAGAGTGRQELLRRTDRWCLAVLQAATS